MRPLWVESGRRAAARERTLHAALSGAVYGLFRRRQDLASDECFEPTLSGERDWAGRRAVEPA